MKHGHSYILFKIFYLGLCIPVYERIDLRLVSISSFLWSWWSLCKIHVLFFWLKVSNNPPEKDILVVGIYLIRYLILQQMQDYVKPLFFITFNELCVFGFLRRFPQLLRYLTQNLLILLYTGLDLNMTKLKQK